MADMDKETQEKIQELQGLEQNLHALLMQKQAFQMELTETENALTEISRSNDEVFKLVGSIMIKADKKTVSEELKKKQELLSLRLKSMETQEKDFSTKAEELKKEVMKKIN
jgi:prefoldin beta subunit